MNGKISHEAFVTRAIETLRGPGCKGIHSVYSGFNEAFREYFHEDPVEATKTLAADGAIEIRAARGGVILYLPGEAPESSGRRALEKILRGALKEEDPARKKVPLNGTAARRLSKWGFLSAFPWLRLLSGRAPQNGV